MRFHEFKLEEGAGQSVYHVTFDKHIPKIKQGGLRPLQTSNWTKAGDQSSRYNEEGGVFAFADPEDAFKWAFKQSWEFKEPVSILRLKRGDSWEKDPSGDIALQMGKGDALRSIAAIPASDVEGAYSFDDFGSPGNGVSQQEWIQNIVNTISGQVTEATPKKQTAAQKKAANEKIRMSTQSGTIDKKQAWGVKKALTSIVSKYAVGDDWELNSSYLDTGLYYVGDDIEEAKRVGQEIIGALYGFFQDGSKKSITKLKREDDANMMSFTAMPMKDQFGQNPPQISFELHKNVKTGGPVIGIHLDV